MSIFPDPMASMMAGVAAGLSKTIVGHPFNTWKLHRQSGLPPPRRIQELYRGLHAPLGRSAIEHGLHMTFRDLVMQELGRWGLGPWSQNPFLVGLLAGIPQALVVAPMDYACTRLQLSKPVLWSESFRGISWFLSKEMLAGMVFFGIYDGGRSVPHLDSNPGLRGSLAAVSALAMTYPLDTVKTRYQAGVCPKTPVCLHAGLGFSLVKCILCNYVALHVYDTIRTEVSKQNARKRLD